MWEQILNLIFPKKCIGCQKEGVWFCENCISKVALCEMPLLRFADSKLDGLISIAYFKEPLKEAIHAFKYDGIRELVCPLSKLAIKHLEDDRLKFIKSFILIPIPLYKDKELERGFNQAALLTEEIAKKLNLKILKDGLVKTKKTKAQMELKGKERRENVKGTFAFIGDKKEIRNKKILLVDDVITTGSTLNEAAKVLKRAGAKVVWGLVVAKD